MDCIICANSINNKIYTVKEMMLGLQENFKYLECGYCGCLQLYEPPAVMSDYYPKDYYSFESNPAIHFKGKIKKWLKGHRDFYCITGIGIFGKIIQKFMPNEGVEFFNFRFAKLKKHHKILDIGSGSGTIPYIFKNAGFKNITGIDPFLDNDISYANGLNIKKLSIFEINDCNWDVIMFNHSFEHVAYPFDYLKKVFNLLANNGCCIIRIPTASSYAWEYYRENWVQLDAPRHFFLHSIKSMEILLEKTGFYIEHIADESTSFQFIGSEQYCIGIPLFGDNRSYFNGNQDIFSANQIMSFKKKAVALNQQRKGDSISVILKKKSGNEIH